MKRIKTIIEHIENRIKMFEYHLEEIKLGKMKKEYELKNEIGLKECKILLNFIKE